MNPNRVSQGSILEPLLFNIDLTDLFFECVEAVARKCSVKRMFLEISQNSRDLLKTLLKKRLLRRCFPVNFTKFLRTPFFTEHLGWLLLNVMILKLMPMTQLHIPVNRIYQVKSCNCSQPQVQYFLSLPIIT